MSQFNEWNINGVASAWVAILRITRLAVVGRHRVGEKCCLGQKVPVPYGAGGG